jgi:two-component system, cell cycle response regulator
MLLVVLSTVWLLTGAGHRPGQAMLWWATGWLAAHALGSVLTIRIAGERGGARHLAVTLFSGGLLGDGVMLAAVWYMFGGLDGPIGGIVILHGISATLLGSFRTGVKIAFWHSLLALIVLEAAAVGSFGPARALELPTARFTLYLTILWAGVLATATFAAVNERELRRRRYDSEVLRLFGAAMAEAHDPHDIARRLAEFARDELLASRTAVLVSTEPGVGVVVVPDGDEAAPTTLPSDWRGHGVLRQALDERRSALVKQLRPGRDPVVEAALPGGQRLIIIPFEVDQTVGALVMEHPRRSSQRMSMHAERRMVITAEQAAAHAATAVSRSVLLARVRAAAETDALTGVANRRTFDAALTAAVERAEATGAGFGLIMVDLDHFKRLNDEHGHQTGDDVLRAAARCLRAQCGDGDLAARYGGEEFAVVVDSGDETVVHTLAEQIRTAIAAADTPVPVTASLGLAMFPTHATSGAQLLGLADSALYTAKANGRNRVASQGSPVRLA